ncbi:hypothetical protein [Sphaerisporangium fuscum]|nr:hypothetical protein [Sphaerisporangium fuscum]
MAEHVSCGTGRAPDNNPFEFDAVTGSVPVDSPHQSELFGVDSPWVG